MEGKNFECLPRRIGTFVEIGPAATDDSLPSMSATIRRSDPREIHPLCLMQRIKREKINRRNGIMIT